MVKKGLIAYLAVVLLVACNTKKTPVQAEDVAVEEAPEIIEEFGFKLNDFNVLKDTIRPGDSFGEILLDHKIDYPTVAKISEEIKETFDVRRINAGKKYLLLKTKDTSEKAQVFIYQNDPINYTVVDFRDTIQAYSSKKPVKVVDREVSGIINTTLSEAVLEQGIDYSVVHNLSDIYAWTVDFFRLQPGDKFKVIYKEKYINDTIYAGSGGVEAAYFEHNGNPFYAFEFETDSVHKTTDYYDEQAKSLRRAFLKAPLNFKRISSRFSRRRFHPVQKRWKAHLGTDYAANYGTPIRATASGTVTRAGYTSGNGKYVKIRHNSVYETQYLHMSRRAVKRGQFVKQGDIIGYVGSTGLATGPHVCYRFWKNGRQVDPLREKLPEAEPIKAELKDGYLQYIQPYKIRLDNIAFPQTEEELITALTPENAPAK